jgi:hypothetical protein
MPSLPSHPLSCRCGSLQGSVARTDRANHGVCYCRSCQAYAHFLGSPRDVLDQLGGTDVVATIPKFVTFSKGRQFLACMSLSPNGLLRWYASCCNTPVGNTPRNYRVSFVGLVHNCLENAGIPVEASFGPVRMRAHRYGAKGEAPSMPWRTFTSVLRFGASLASARLGGGYRVTPFFDASGTPIVQPGVLTQPERERLFNAL